MGLLVKPLPDLSRAVSLGTFLGSPTASASAFRLDAMVRSRRWRLQLKDHGFLDETRKRAGMAERLDEINYFAGLVGAVTERR